MAKIDVYPAEVVEVNGSPTGPYPAAPASTFRYTVDVVKPGGVQRVTNDNPNCQRWPDSIKVTPILPGTAVLVFCIEDKVVMADRELPDFTPCTPPP
jgi:hypothetical protein